MVAAWVLLWILIGVVVGESVAALTGLTGAFRAVGEAIGGVGTTLASLELPLVGGALDDAGEAVAAAGEDVSARGQAVRGSIERAAVMVGAAVALAPTAPVLVAYLPARVARARDAGAMRAFLGAGGGELELERFLADRARASLSYRRLRAVAERPWADDPDTLRALAAAEVRRLGLSGARLDTPGDERQAGRSQSH